MIFFRALLLTLFWGSFMLVSVYGQPGYCGTSASDMAQAYLERNREAIHRFAKSSLDSRANEVIRIQPHIITRKDGSGGLSHGELEREISQLNIFFSGMKVSFEICETDYIRDDQFYDFDADYEDLLISHDRPNVINVYFPATINIDANPVCGYAYFPGSNKSIVVVAAECATNGVTLAHEIGHYFSLYHTHGKSNNGTTDELVDGSNCATAGDDICDTPADPNLDGKVSAGCKYVGLAKDANGEVFVPQPGNIMSYSLDQCMKFFTPEQYNRMRFSLENDRNQLLKENPACQVFGLDNCKFEVENLNDSGQGSLRYAIRCANLNPGPDTIRFAFDGQEEETIKILTAFPALKDDGTYIDGRLQNGEKIIIDASKVSLASVANANPAILFVDGDNIEITNLEIRNFVRAESQALHTVAAIWVADFADSFRIRDNVFYNNLTSVQIGRANGDFSNNQLRQNVLGILTGKISEGIQFRQNSFICNSRGPIDFNSDFTRRFLSHVPKINGGNNQRLTGISEPGAIIDIFERNINDCSFTPCQGSYLGSTQADNTGNWAFDHEFLVLNNYTATATIIEGGNWLTSEFADCFRIVEEETVWIYPNPSDGILTLEINGKTPQNPEIFLFDMYGRRIPLPNLIKEKTYSKTTLDLGFLAQGHYFIRIDIGDESVVKRLMIR